MGISYSGNPARPGEVPPDPRPPASVVIRTFNEARYLDEVLSAIASQHLPAGKPPEVVLVDSGSTDGTLEIAKRHGAKIVQIRKEDFTFGRSLNLGSEASRAPVLVLLSGHCIPATEHWLENLLRPFNDPGVAAVYGRQLANEEAKFSEGRVFAKYYPDGAASQGPAFCNNANAAVRRSIWRRFRYDETLTGLEDIDFGRKVVGAGFRITYAPDAPVFHIHHESWPQVRRRYEREAIALRHIHPELHLSLPEALACFTSAVSKDLIALCKESRFSPGKTSEIVRYRWNQFYGSWLGNRPHRELSAREKIRYFFPT